MWFHTKDIHGSHVILKLSPGETASIDAIHESARLAALHSKAKDSTNIPVDYCKVSFVKKPHGSKPGMVIYSNNQTIYIKKSKLGKFTPNLLFLNFVCLYNFH